LIEEQYECVVAFFRGGEDSEFVWYDSQKELETWVQFIYIDQMVKVAPKLLA
jgi:4'-phosphopantetheinyl transferase